MKLKRLKLSNNRLITLPSAIHLLPDLQELDVRNNRQLVMPPKPSEQAKRLQYYNIDFSLDAQRRAAGQTTGASSLSLLSRALLFLKGSRRQETRLSEAPQADG